MPGTGAGGGGSGLHRPTPEDPARPKPAPLVFSVSKLRLLGMALLCVPFVLAGIYLISKFPDWGSVLMGSVTVLFFGGGGLWVLWTKLRQPTVLTLSGEGIKPESGGLIPWDDFDAAGIGRIPGGSSGTKVIGIRLNSYERFVKSFTPDELRLMRGANTAARFTAVALPKIAGGSVRSNRSMKRSLGHLRSLPRQDEASLPLQDVAGTLAWNRGLCGWDITFSPLVFRGSADTVVRDIENYHQAVKRRSGA